MSNKDTGEKSDESTSDVNASFSCDECGKTFDSRQELKEHTHWLRQQMRKWKSEIIRELSSEYFSTSALTMLVTVSFDQNWVIVKEKT